ncbi:MAG: MmgE/PrpD family protein [Alphaproteobacteria bacterium]|nr:MmgE/PrpD family protein [Alphaproteobacteria bacterium]
MKPLAPVLAEWVSDLRHKALPSDVVADCRLRLLDIVGLCLAATSLPLGRAVRKGAKALGEGKAAEMLGYGDRTTAALAGLVNGTLAHGMDFDDTHNASVMHSSAPVVATALAAGQEAGIDGRALLVAIAAGNELNCRLGMVAPGAFHQPGLHPTSVLGTATAALVAGKLLGLKPAALVAAAGISGSQASGILEAYSDGTWSKTLHPGWAAHGGIVAAQLAKSGFTGPATVFEGRYGIFRSHVQAEGYDFQFKRATTSLGKRWELLENSFKFFPNAHAIHAFVEAALQLRATHGLAAADIASVELVVPAHFVGQIAEPREAKLKPRTATHARASLFYAVAGALAHGKLDMADYTEKAIRKPDVLRLAKRITHRVSEAPTGAIRFTGHAIIETKDGRRLEATIEDARGTGKRKVGAAEIEAKFRETAGTVVKRDRVERLIELIGGVEKLSSLAPIFAAARLTPRRSACS